MLSDLSDSCVKNADYADFCFSSLHCKIVAQMFTTLNCLQVADGYARLVQFVSVLLQNGRFAMFKIHLFSPSDLFH